MSFLETRTRSFGLYHDDTRRGDAHCLTERT
ncbi:hypothetical protein DFP92_106144 [Yoonia sediminilitoris]|uniref:Uncharacterized protein n=1 Tax=Yoonia sediminilitoris TaxID=1286148 RepID=A0A2T6KG65_9RHOB|nr:hypothetical protein C8N45_106144 [Yoonia sediminilitoris]RCW95201.1 hypothetical protein DFP92_106144 [Yoonia sediminilitoris]